MDSLSYPPAAAVHVVPSGSDCLSDFSWDVRVFESSSFGRSRLFVMLARR